MPALLAAGSRPLPEPRAGWTVPIAVVLALLALFWLVRKLLLAAVVAALVAAAVLAYQAGAFNAYVDRGKAVLRQHTGSLSGGLDDHAGGYRAPAGLVDEDERAGDPVLAVLVRAQRLGGAQRHPTDLVQA